MSYYFYVQHMYFLSFDFKCLCNIVGVINTILVKSCAIQPIWLR